MNHFNDLNLYVFGGNVVESLLLKSLRAKHSCFPTDIEICFPLVNKYMQP